MFNCLSIARKRCFLLVVPLVLLLSGAPQLAQVPSSFPQTPTAENQFQQIAEGVEYLQLVRQAARNEASDGPWVINALRIDLRKASLRFARALDEAVGLETTSSIAARNQAVAAVNGGYFRTTGTFRGDSVGTFVMNRKLISESHHDRATVGLIGKASQRTIFGHLKFSGELSTRSVRQAISGFNRPVSENELVIFTPEFHRTTLTNPEGVEVLVRHGKVIRIHDLRGSSEIPSDGIVISATGRSRQWVLRSLRKGSPVTISWRLEPTEASQKDLWRQAESIVGGGPQLIKDGKVNITNSEESIAPAFVTDRHPRTAIALLSSDKVLLLTVDGRQPGVSAGMSLPGLAELLLEFGALEAINLDGGGSTTMVIRNKVVNKPSDQTGERAVSDAVLVFARSN